MTITCGKCGTDSDIDLWISTPIAGELPRNIYQCPKCKYAFEKRYGKATVYPSGFVAPGPVELKPVAARL